MHHDGNARALTVLYYLNGVGETWLHAATGPILQSGMLSTKRSQRAVAMSAAALTHTIAMGPRPSTSQWMLGGRAPSALWWRQVLRLTFVGTLLGVL